MDWNGDGNHDWQDDAFYNNVMSDSGVDTSGSNVSAPSPLRFVLIAALIIYILVKIFN